MALEHFEQAVTALDLERPDDLAEQKQRMRPRTATADGADIRLLANINLLVDLNLATELGHYEASVTPYIKEGATEILVRHINLPQNDLARKNNKKAMEGLKTLKNKLSL